MVVVSGTWFESFYIFFNFFVCTYGHARMGTQVWARTHGHARAKERPGVVVVSGTCFESFFFFTRTATHVRPRTYGHVLVLYIKNNPDQKI